MSLKNNVYSNDDSGNSSSDNTVLNSTNFSSNNNEFIAQAYRQGRQVMYDDIDAQRGESRIQM